MPKKTPVEPASKGRKRKVSKYKSFRLTKRIPHPAGPLPSAWSILRKTRRLIWANKKTLLIIFVVFTLLNLVFVRGFASPLNVADVKDSLQQTLGKNPGKSFTTLAIFGHLLGSGTSTVPSSGVYQTILVIMVSLALVWVFRQYAAGHKPNAKRAFYEGMYPVIPFLLVLSVMVLQLIPAVIGIALYSATVSSGVAASGIEQGLWTVLTVMLIILTLYMLLSSFFALYVVTLPGMTPMKALRSSRQLVFSRRLSVLRKILLLPLLLAVVLVILVVPTIYFASVLAPWLYYLLTISGLFVLNAYLFNVYLALL